MGCSRRGILWKTIGFWLKKKEIKKMFAINQINKTLKRKTNFEQERKGGKDLREIPKTTLRVVEL